MVPSEPIAAELWMSELGVVAEPSLIWKLPVLKERITLGSRGPRLGLRPVCCASIWYMGRPIAGFGTAVGSAVGSVVGSGVAVGGTASGMAVGVAALLVRDSGSARQAAASGSAATAAKRPKTARRNRRIAQTPMASEL